VDTRNPKPAIRGTPEGRGSNERAGDGVIGFALRALGFLRPCAWLLLLLVLLPSPAGANGEPPRSVIIAVGAPGEEPYAEVFAQSARRWTEACAAAGVTPVVLGLAAEERDGRERLREALAREAQRTEGELWIVLIGHGTFDGREARFNFRGADLLAGDLAEWLAPVKRPLILINTTAASGPFLNRLSAPGRVILTATRSGAEQNFARFGQYLAEAIGGVQADLDKDGQVSLLEAFLAGARGAAEFYEREGRLATEHALIDDNGDGLGTPADWFQGIRAVKRAKAGAEVDGLRAHQIHLIRSAAERALPPEVRARRDELELQLARLRERKEQMSEDDYYAALEELLLDLARVYQNMPAPRAGERSQQIPDPQRLRDKRGSGRRRRPGRYCA
jgi:hypothetical protein